MIVYVITNKINNKKYVGCTVGSLENRWKQHKYRRFTNHSAIASAIRKYGPDNFTIVQVDTATDFKDMYRKEKEWIHKLNTLCDTGHGYNILNGDMHNQKTSDDIFRITHNKIINRTSRSKTQSSYYGIFYTQERHKWGYEIAISGKTIAKAKNLATAKDAAIARDYKIVNIFPKDKAVQIMNFPADYHRYLNNIIDQPKIANIRNPKQSKFMWVSILGKNKKCFRAGVPKNNGRIRFGNFLNDAHAAEYADFLIIKHNLNLPLNFPEKETLYRNADYEPPKNIIESQKSCHHKHISFYCNRYECHIVFNNKHYRKSFLVLNDALNFRNAVLNDLALPIPD